MDKYALLITLNLPFIFFGIIKAWAMYKKRIVNRFGLLLRLLFWLVIAAGLIFDREIYNFLVAHHLTDSVPLSLADVVLTTGVIFSLFLCMRIYTKLDLLERRVDELHERLSIRLSSKS